MTLRILQPIQCRACPATRETPEALRIHFVVCHPDYNQQLGIARKAAR